MKDKHDITSGQDKFEPIDHSLLRLHIADLSQPIRPSRIYATRNSRKKDNVTASLFTALAIIVTVGLIIYVNR